MPSPALSVIPRPSCGDRRDGHVPVGPPLEPRRRSPPRRSIETPVDSTVDRRAPRRRDPCRRRSSPSRRRRRRERAAAELDRSAGPSAANAPCLGRRTRCLRASPPQPVDVGMPPKPDASAPPPMSPKTIAETRAADPLERGSAQQQPEAPADQEQRPERRPAADELRVEQRRPGSASGIAPTRMKNSAPAEEPAIEVHRPSEAAAERPSNVTIRRQSRWRRATRRDGCARDVAMRQVRW